MSQDKEFDLDFLEELSAEPPIIPYEKGKKHGQSGKIKYQGKGWQYYLTIKSKLQDWWEEFNSKDKSTTPKYKSVKQFIKSRTKNKQQQEWLYQMFGPAPLPDEKMEVPWLADWNKRRKNGYWNTEDGFEYRRLAKIIKNNLEARQATKEMLPFFFKDLARFERLQSKIDEKFAGEPFVSGNPMSSSNRNRYKVYLRMQLLAARAKMEIGNQCMRFLGYDPAQPNQLNEMALLAQLSGQVGAAAALTGYTANKSLPEGATSTPDGGIVLSKDALMLATHLTRHAQDWKKNLPDIELNGDELVEKPAQSVKENKTNGKHKEIQ